MKLNSILRIALIFALVVAAYDAAIAQNWSLNTSLNAKPRASEPFRLKSWAFNSPVESISPSTIAAKVNVAKTNADEVGAFLHVEYGDSKNEVNVIYGLPQEINHSGLMLTYMDGKFIKGYSLEKVGNLKIETSTIAAGYYMLTLIGDGKSMRYFKLRVHK